MAINREQLDAEKREKDKPQPTLYIAAEMDAAEVFDLPFGRLAAFSHSSPDKTTGNEDCAALIPIDSESGVLVVADGVGGMPTGGAASRITVETLSSNLANAQQDQSPRDTILDGIEQANRAVLALGNGAATTVVVIEVQGNSIRPYHVGDSLILVTGQHGRLKLQNIPHSPTGYAVEAGLLDESDAIHHEERNLVSNVVGDTEMRIEIGPSIELAPRDTLVLASDGLSDNLYLEEIVNTVRVRPLSEVAAALARRAVLRMENPVPGKPSHPDDLTFMLFRRPPLPRKQGRTTGGQRR